TSSIVNIFTWRSGFSRDGRNVNDDARDLVTLKVFDSLAATFHGAKYIDTEHLFDSLAGGLFERPDWASDTAVVDQRCNRAELLFGLREHLWNVSAFGDIALNRHGPPATPAHGLGHLLGGSFVFNVANGDIEAVARRKRGRCGTNSAARARNQHYRCSFCHIASCQMVAHASFIMAYQPA